MSGGLKGIAILALASAVAGEVSAQVIEGGVTLPHEITFKAPLTPGGTQSAVLYGDPTKQGMFVTRVKFAPGVKSMPHWHPDVARTVVVLSGTLYFGMGEQWDESKLKACPAGTFIAEAPRTPHFTWAKDGEVILQSRVWALRGRL